jgi:ribosomal protein S27E
VNKRLNQTEMLELVLEDLRRWLSYGDSDCSMRYAYRHGFYLHAANLWLDSGAASDEVCAKVRTLKISRKAEMKEINELCNQAFIYICPDCNHHAFLASDEGETIRCISCLKTARLETKETENE